MIKKLFDIQGNAMTKMGMRAFSVTISGPQKQRGRPDFYCRVRFSAPRGSSMQISGVSEAQAVGLALDYVKANLVYLLYSDGTDTPTPEVADSFPLRG